MNRRQRGHHVRSAPDWRGKLISDASAHSPDTSQGNAAEDPDLVGMTDLGVGA